MHVVSVLCFPNLGSLKPVVDSPVGLRWRSPPLSSREACRACATRGLCELAHRSEPKLNTHTYRVAALPLSAVTPRENPSCMLTQDGFRKGERCSRRQWRKQRAERINRNEQSNDSESATIEVADRTALRRLSGQRPDRSPEAEPLVIRYTPYHPCTSAGPQECAPCHQPAGCSPGKR